MSLLECVCSYLGSKPPINILPSESLGSALKQLTCAERESLLIRPLAANDRYLRVAELISQYTSELDCDDIDALQLSDQSQDDQNQEQRVRVLINRLMDIPELTIELFIEVLYKQAYDVTAIELAKRLNLHSLVASLRPRQTSQEVQHLMRYLATKVKQLNALSSLSLQHSNVLRLTFWQFLNKRPHLRQQLVEALCMRTHDSSNWKGISAHLVKQGFRHFSSDFVAKIVGSYAGTGKQAYAFLTSFKEMPHVTLEDFLKALLATCATYESLVLRLLTEVGCQHAFPLLSVPLAKPKCMLDERLEDSHICLDIEMYLRKVKGPRDFWLHFLGYLELQPQFKGKFQPSPAMWYQNAIMNVHQSDIDDTILQNIQGLLALTVRVFVVALFKTGKDFSDLVRTICKMVDAPEFAEALIAGDMAATSLMVCEAPPEPKAEHQVATGVYLRRQIAAHGGENRALSRKSSVVDLTFSSAL